MKQGMIRLIGLTAVFLATMILIMVNQVVATPTILAGSDGFVYLPIVTKPLNQDLVVTAVEVNQSIQRANNTVPLVANRNTLVRVYAEVLSGVPLSNVVVRLSATRGGNPIGQIDSLPTTIPVDATRDDEDSTVNFQILPSWLSGNVNLTATVDPSNAIIEPNEGNNTVVTAVTFNNVPDLQIVIVPINYTHSGSNDPGYYPAQSVDYITDWLMRAYPIDNVAATIRTPYNFSGNLEEADYWQNLGETGLLDRMYQLKLADGYPADTPVVYYAFVPTSNGSSQWFYSGIAGIGWIGYRESVGLNLGNTDQTATLAGHEIGHNMGRRHAPCGNPAGVDPYFPYAGASIGEYGIDIPQGNFWTPATAVDVMSYCSPEWVSDYTYIGLYNDQMANGFALAQTAVASMIVSAGLSDSGEVSIHPTYAFSSFPATAVTSEYQVELLDEDGNLLVTQAMQLREAVEEGVSGRMLTAVIPLPAQPAAALHIVQDGQIVASRPLNNVAAFGQQTAVANREGNIITLSWGQADTPTIIRYSPDGGQSWTALGLGIEGGTFTVDATTLPAGDNGLFEMIPANTGSVVRWTAVLP
jgi:hypothetical protein